MRITNKMITNNMLININRNQNKLNEYDIQIATGKKIQHPSEDPIIAVRALRFRTTVSEISQYKVNCEDAISWCEVSEQSVSNVTDICKRIRELAVQASSDTLNAGNRKKIKDEMNQLSKQFLNEVNTSYAGRYIFSGFKTSTPSSFVKESADEYSINQNFSSSDIQKIKKVVDTPQGERIKEVSRVRLAYSDLKSIDAASLGLTVNEKNSTDSDSYEPAQGEVNVLLDTGEIIFNDDDVAGLPTDFEINFEKSGFKKNDLVPENYFECTNKTKNITYDGDREDMEYQISYSQMLKINSRAEEVVPLELQRDLEEIIKNINDIKEDGTLKDELKADIVGDSFSRLIGKMDSHIDNLLKTRADIGARINRLNLTINRLADDKLNFTDIMSKNEDIDYAETYTKMSSMQSVYRASLSAAAKSMSSTLLDFIR